ncbi:class I adenylate-forming enzyme family protein [Marinibaculum pumilum]|uniref:Class I adenylate-forming enzyme family protein n=1 Tax=Marinibaculum pumilum TaxID=1766165 RepID=A0ABV7L3B3_9PROT
MNAATQSGTETGVAEADWMLPVPFLGISEHVAAHARHRGGEPALIQDGQATSWASFDAAVNRVANALRAGGLAKGQRVALLAGNTGWTYTALLGVLRAGGVVAPLSPLLTPEIIRRLADDCDAQVLFAGQGYEAMAAAVMRTEGWPPARRVVAEAGGADGMVPFDRFIADAPDTAPDVVLTARDWCNIVYSSGTTGVPKGIVHSHQARIWQAGSLACALRFEPGGIAMQTVPPHSNYSWASMLACIGSATAMLVMPKFDPAAFLRIVAQVRPSQALLVPTQFQALLDSPLAAETDLSCFRSVLSAGAPLGEGLQKRVLAAFPDSFFELWGLTEGVATMIGPAEKRQRPESVGRAMIGTVLKIVGEEGEELPAGQAGEIVGTSMGLLRGYHNRPEQTAELVWRDAAGRLYIRTGDVGEFDADGYLTLRGRKKDMIISGGFNIFPVDIEEVLRAHEAVLDAAVIGVPHEKWGETPVGLVTLRPGTTVEAAALKDWANGRLAKHQRLADLAVAGEDFPRNTMGKVLKGELRDAWLARG